jgi:hypothetical protein
MAREVRRCSGAALEIGNGQHQQLAVGQVEASQLRCELHDSSQKAGKSSLSRSKESVKYGSP